MASEARANRPRRSALYLPASNLRAIEKSRFLGCDTVIFDLEDAVAPDMKGAARANAVAALATGGFGPREVVVRVNGLDTPWGAADIDALATVGADAVLLPKVASASVLADVARRLPDTVPLWAMIETPLAILEIASLVREGVASRLECLVAGTNDLAKDMRCKLDAARAALAPALFAIVAAGRANGMAVLDGVFNDIADEEGFGRQCEQGATLGFDGKTLIHPSQIGGANALFSPPAQEVAWARKVAAAFAEPGVSGLGVLKVDGRMVERLHLHQAIELIAKADAIAAKEGQSQ